MRFEDPHSVMINVTGGNAWLMDDASVYLFVLSSLCLFPCITELVMVVSGYEKVQNRSSVGRQHKEAGLILQKALTQLKTKVCV
jgi:hypothetical protein